MKIVRDADNEEISSHPATPDCSSFTVENPRHDGRIALTAARRCPEMGKPRRPGYPMIPPFSRPFVVTVRIRPGNPVFKGGIIPSNSR
jgi:hypothetical protein